VVELSSPQTLTERRLVLVISIENENKRHLTGSSVQRIETASYSPRLENAEVVVFTDASQVKEPYPRPRLAGSLSTRFGRIFALPTAGNFRKVKS
jgi:hypothetical protein